MNTPSSMPLFSSKGIWNTRCDALHRLIVSFFPLFIFCLSFFLFSHLLSYFLPYSFILKIYLSSLFLQSLCLPSFSSLPYFPPLPFSLFSSPFHMFNCSLTVSLSPLLYSPFCLPPHFPSSCLSFPSCFTSLFSLLFLFLSPSLVFTAQLWVPRQPECLPYSNWLFSLQPDPEIHYRTGFVIVNSVEVIQPNVLNVYV